MSDVEEVISAVALMQHVIDNRQWELLDQVYTDDGVFVLSSGKSFEGLTAVREIMLTFAHPVAHYTTNELVTVETPGKSARVRSKVLGISEAGELLIGGYDDQLEKSDRWRVRKRVCSLHARLAVGAPVAFVE